MDERSDFMKKKYLFGILGLALVSLASCGSNDISNLNPNTTTNIDIEENKSHAVPLNANDYYKDIKDEFTLSTTDGVFDFSTDSNNTKVYTIKESGTYIVKGLLENGQIIVEGADLEVDIEFHGVKITNSYNSPVFIKKGTTCKIKVMEDTYNEILDLRNGKESDVEALGEAAIYSKCDLKISGRGALVINGGYNNGIASTDDLTIKNVILNATARNNTLKGNDSLIVESGQLIINSLAGDGLKTDNTDLSGRGNQHGSIHILGGVIDIYSKCDGIDSAYDLTIATGVSLRVFTGKYVSSNDSLKELDELYIKSTLDKDKYRYALYFYNDDQNDGVLIDCEYTLSMKTPDLKDVYYYKLANPKSYKNVKLYVFEIGKAYSINNYYAVSEGAVINPYKDLFDIKETLGDTVIYDYNTYAYSNNEIKEDTINSKKGLKARNEIIFYGGTTYIKSEDDAIHANSDVNVESISQGGYGNVTINGGYLDLYSDDDAIHGDNIVTINNCYLNVISSYEGIEGNIINFNGGETKISSLNDGVNASNGKYTPYVNVTGGKLDITVGLGDTDGIDSNGNYLQSGGEVISRCSSISKNIIASPLDIEGDINITGGTLILLGSIDKLPNESIPYVWLKNKEFNPGDYKVKELDLKFNLSDSYKGLFIASSLLEAGKTYTLGDYSWHQEKETVVN